MLLQVVPGRSRTLPSAFSSVEYNDKRYILFISQDCVVVYNADDFVHLQTLDLGLGDGKGMLSEDPDDEKRYFPTSVSMCEITGKVAVACGTFAVIFRPSFSEVSRCIRWTQNVSLPHTDIVKCVEWSNSGNLVTAGKYLALWEFTNEAGTHSGGQTTWKSTWMQELAVDARLVKFSPDGEMIASVGQNDPYVKIWYKEQLPNGTIWAFTYLKHPEVVLDFTWRKVAKSYRASSPPCIYTRCTDHFLRIFACSNPLSPQTFYLVAHIDPLSSSTLSISQPPKTVHWVDNEALTEAVGRSVARLGAKGENGMKEEKVKRLRDLVKDAPDLFLGVGEDGAVVIWGVQNLSAGSPRRIPKVLLVMRMAQALSPSDEPYFGGNCLIYCSPEEAKRKSPVFPASLTILAQSPYTGRTNAYSLSLTDFFDSTRTISRLILRHSWGGHDATVKKIIKSEYDDALFVSVDRGGVGVFWRREVPAAVAGRVREGLVEIGEVAGWTGCGGPVNLSEEDDGVDEEAEEERKAIGGCKVVTFLPTGLHVAIYDGAAVHLHRLTPSATGYLPRITTLPSIAPFTADDPIVLLHSLEMPEPDWSKMSSAKNVNASPPTRADDLGRLRYYVIHAITEMGHVWSWGCLETHPVAHRATDRGSCDEYMASSLNGSSACTELDIETLRLLKHTSKPLLPVESGPFIFSPLLRFSAFSSLHATPPSVASQHLRSSELDEVDDVFVSYSHGDRTIRSWAWNWKSVTEQSGTNDGRPLWIETASGDAEGYGTIKVMKAGAMGKVALVIDEGQGFSTIEIWSKDPDSKDFEPEHAVEFSPASGFPVDVSWLLVSDSHQLLALAFYDRVVVLYPVRQSTAANSAAEVPFSSTTDTRPSQERERTRISSSPGRKRSLGRRQSMGRRGSVVLVVDATSKMRQDGGWKRVMEVVLGGMTSHPIGALSWLWNGSLVVAAGHQLFCYNKWVVPGEATIACAPYPSSPVSPSAPSSTTSPSHAPYHAPISTIFNISRSLNSVLPHHHPQLLVQYLLWGKLEIVKMILMYLYRFWSALHDSPGSWSPDGVKLMHGLPSVPFTTFLEHDQITTLRTPFVTSRTSLFDDDAFGGDLDRSKTKQGDSFTEDGAAFLTEQLTKVALPNITNVEQMLLMAIIDTVVQVERQKRSLDENGVRYLLFARLYAYLVRSSPMHLRPTGLTSRDMAWAFHSESQDILLEASSNLAGGKILWKDARAMGIALWIRNPDTLRQQLEIIARNQYMAKEPRDPIDASIFFLALRKRKLLHGLWKTANGHPEQSAMVKFLANDFDEERWKSAALKNAFALLGKQRFEYAAAFFLLGDCLTDAVSVCLKHLNDYQLAIAICRAYEGDEGPVLPGILQNTVIPKAVERGDRWLASMVYSMRKERDRAIQATMIPLKTFLVEEDAVNEAVPAAEEQKKKEETDPALLVLFGFLCRQSNGYRQRGNYKVDPDEEEEFVIRSVIAYEQFGCPMLALRVLETWVVERSPEKLKSPLSKKEMLRESTIITGALDWDWEASGGGSSEKAEDLFAEPTVQKVSKAADLFDDEPTKPARAADLFGDEVSSTTASHKASDLFGDDTEEKQKPISLFDDYEPSKPSFLDLDNLDQPGKSLVESPTEVDPTSSLAKGMFDDADLDWLNVAGESAPKELTTNPERIRTVHARPIGSRLRLYKITLGMQLLEHVVTAVHVATSYSTMMQKSAFFCEYLDHIKEGLTALCKVIGIEPRVIDELLISRCFETDSYGMAFQMLSQGILMSEQDAEQFTSFLVNGSNNITYLIFHHSFEPNCNMLVGNLGSLSRSILSTFHEWFMVISSRLPQARTRLSVLRVVILSFTTYVVAAVCEGMFDRLALCLFHCRSFLDACSTEGDISGKLPAILETILKGEITMPSVSDTDDEMFSDDCDENGFPIAVDGTKVAIAEQIVSMMSLNYFANCIGDFISKSGDRALPDDLVFCLRTAVLEPLASKQWSMEDEIKRSPHSSILKNSPATFLRNLSSKKCWAILRNQNASSLSDNFAEPTSKPAELQQFSVAYRPRSVLSAFCVNPVDKRIVSIATQKRVYEIDTIASTHFFSKKGNVTAGNLSSSESIPKITIRHDSDGSDEGDAHSDNEGELRRRKSFRNVNRNLSFDDLAKAFSKSYSTVFPKADSVLDRDQDVGQRLKRNYVVGAMESHPSFPFYITGSEGSSGHDTIYLWQFGQSKELLAYSGSKGKITSLHFDVFGQKFGSTDTTGHLNLWRFEANQNGLVPFQTILAHGRGAFDFAFLGSSSFIGTVGLSNDNANVCFWDTLLPPNRQLVQSFNIHETGALSLAYSTRTQVLATAGKKGDIAIINVPQRRVIKIVQAHESSIRTIAIDESRGALFSGTVDGDVKMFDFSALEEMRTWKAVQGKTRFLRPTFGIHPLKSSGVTHMLVIDGKVHTSGPDGLIILEPALFLQDSDDRSQNEVDGDPS